MWDISRLLLLVRDGETRGVSEELVAVLLVQCLCILTVTEGQIVPSPSLASGGVQLREDSHLK